MNFLSAALIITLCITCKGYSTQSASELTVECALKIPCQNRIKKELESRGGTYTTQAEQLVVHHMRSILQGTFSLGHVPSTPSSSLHIAKSALQALLASPQITSITQGALSSLKNLIPSLTSTLLMKSVAATCATVHATIAEQKRLIQAQENELISSVHLRLAHYFAVESVVRLLFIIFSSRSKPCERMHALYLVNTVHLLGNQGAAFSRWRDRTNRFYFTQEGKLQEFDPSKHNGQTPKRVKALNYCLKTLAYSQGNYLSLLKAGMYYGISGLNDHDQRAVDQAWNSKKNRFIWLYAAHLFKEATSVDVMHFRTVDPERIFAHKENRDLLSLMLLTSPSEIQTTGSSSLDAAQKLISSNEGNPSAHYLRRYYNELASRAAS